MTVPGRMRDPDPADGPHTRGAALHSRVIEALAAFTPSTVPCPVCGNGPHQPCVDHGAQHGPYWHRERARRFVGGADVHVVFGAGLGTDYLPTSGWDRYTGLFKEDYAAGGQVRGAGCTSSLGTEYILKVGVRIRSLPPAPERSRTLLHSPVDMFLVTELTGAGRDTAVSELRTLYSSGLMAEVIRSWCCEGLQDTVALLRSRIGFGRIADPFGIPYDPQLPDGRFEVAGFTEPEPLFWPEEPLARALSGDLAALWPHLDPR